MQHGKKPDQYKNDAKILVLTLVMCLGNLTSALTFPGINAPSDELIAYYYKLLYTGKEICGFLLYFHNITLSLRQLKRIKRKLGLRRHMSSPAEVVSAIKILHREGFGNNGYKFIWRMLNTFCNDSASQETVRLALSVIDPDGVNVRSRHRLRRRIYFYKGPNYLLHMDG